MRRATECAGYPSQLAAVRAMALAGVGRAEIRQRTGLDSHRVGSLLAKVRAEERRGAPAWDAAREAKARRIYRAGVLVMAEHFGVTMAEFMLHATGVPGAGQEESADGVLGPEGWGDGDVGAAGAAGEPVDRDAGGEGPALGVAVVDATHESGTAQPQPDAGPPLAGDAGEDDPAAPVADTAAEGAAGEPGAEAAAREGAAVEAVEPQVQLSAPPADVAPPALADTESDGEVHLRSWDGKRLHVNGRVLTRIPRFYWRGSRAAAEALRRKLPAAWGALSMVPAWRVL